MQKDYPFYIKVPIILLGIVIAVFILSVLRDILVPLAFAGLIAILLNTLSNRLERKVPKIIAIIISMLIAIVVLAGLLFLLSSQVAHFFDDLDAIKHKLGTLFHDLQIWVQKSFGFSASKQTKMITEAANSSKGMIGQTLTGLMGILSVIFLIPVYVFLLMLYKTLILNFLYEVFSEENQTKVAEILSETNPGGNYLETMCQPNIWASLKGSPKEKNDGS